MRKRGHQYKGFLAHFDGPDGGGKGTQMDWAEKYLRNNGYVVSRFRDPGGTEVGDQIRRVLLHLDTKEMKPETEVFLFMASRVQLVREKIQPALERGEVVLLDRFVDATRAYQGTAGKVPVKYIDQLAKLATNHLSPDRSYFLDVPAETGLKRIDREKDRIESKALEYHQAVRQGFLKIAAREHGRVLVLDGTQDPKVIHQQIVNDLETRLTKHQQVYRLLRTSQD